MRPVGAPEHALGVGFEQRSGEWHRVGVGELRRGDAIRAGQLHPRLPAFHQPQQRLEPRIVRGLSDRQIPEMAQHDVHREIGERKVEIGKLVRMHQQFHVPAKRRDALRERLQCGHRQGAGLAVLHVDDVDAHAPHARGVEFLQLRVRHILRNDRDAAHAPARRLHRVEHRRVVGAIDAGLHQHRALDAERVEHVQVIGEQAVRRSVDSRRGIRVARGGTHDVRVRVTGTGRHSQPGLARVEVGIGAGRRLGARGFRFALRDHRPAYWKYWPPFTRYDCPVI